MDFKEYLLESDKKYTFGTWKKTIGLIINDFSGTSDDSLEEMLGGLKAFELKNTIRNAEAYLGSPEGVENKKFLENLISTAEKYLKKMPGVTATEKDWETFKELLGSHDKHYDKSDDSRVYQAGKKTADKIQELKKRLMLVDKERVLKMMK